MTSPRQTLADALAPMLPEGWDIIPYQKGLGTLSKTIVMLKQSEIRPHPAAPQQHLEVDFTVTIASPRTDPQRAEDELDDAVLDLIHAIDAAGYRWTNARKVKFSEQNLGWDFDLQLDSPKKETPDA